MEADERTCPDCAEVIKAAAIRCRYCGRDLGSEAAKSDDPTVVRVDVPAPSAAWSNSTLAAIGGAFAFVIVALVAFATYHSRVAGPRAQLAAIEVSTREAISRDFLDPGSAQFRNMSINNACVTGEANGKNALGAYIGYKSFYYIVDENAGESEANTPDPRLSSSDEALANLRSRVAYTTGLQRCTEKLREKVNAKTFLKAD